MLELATVNIERLARLEEGDDTSSMWWVTLKLLRRLGFSADEYGKGIAIFVRGDGQIVRSDDARIETFIYDARHVIGLGGQRSERLSDYQSGLAFSVELYANHHSYNPIYGFVTSDPVELARRYLFALGDLVAAANLPLLNLDSLAKRLEAAKLCSPRLMPGPGNAAERS